MKKVLLTGGSGFIGSHLIKKLRDENCEIASMGRTIVKSCDNYLVNDFTDLDEIRDIIYKSEPDYIFHLAGSVSLDMQSSLKLNTIFGHNILNSLSILGLENKIKVMFVGSAAEYGIVPHTEMPVSESTSTIPFSNNGISKLASTLDAISWCGDKKNLTVVRPFTVIGEGLPEYLAIGNFIKQIAIGYDGMTLKTGNLSTSRDFIDVLDLVEILWKLINTKNSYGEIFNICSGKPVVISEILEYIAYKVKININIETSNELVRDRDMQVHYGSNKKLMELIGPMKLISWRESIDRIVLKL